MERVPSISEKRRTSAPMSNREEVDAFLEDYANALAASDVHGAAAMWDVPAIVVGDGGVHAVSDAEEIEGFFAQAHADYLARGIVDTKPEIMRVEFLTDLIATVEVRWQNVDANGAARGYEMTTYTLRRDEGGRLRLRVAVLQGESRE